MLTTSIEQSKLLFFDGKKVESALDRAERRFMSRFGAFVRSDARRSMRKQRRGRPSKPGTPPRRAIGYLRDFLFFVYDPRQHDVIIGPALLSGSSTPIPVPGFHEKGGVLRMMNGVVARYPARPYMRPAFNKNLTRVDELRNSIK